MGDKEDGVDKIIAAVEDHFEDGPIPHQIRVAISEARRQRGNGGETIEDVIEVCRRFGMPSDVPDYEYRNGISVAEWLHIHLDEWRRLRIERQTTKALVKVGRAVLDKSDERGFVTLDPPSLSACVVCNYRGEYEHADWCPVPAALTAPQEGEGECTCVKVAGTFALGKHTGCPVHGDEVEPFVDEPGDLDADPAPEEEPEAWEGKLEEAIGALEALWRETRPIEGHDDPGALQDCYLTVRKAILRAHRLLFDRPAPGDPDRGSLDGIASGMTWPDVLTELAQRLTGGSKDNRAIRDADHKWASWLREQAHRLRASRPSSVSGGAGDLAKRAHEAFLLLDDYFAYGEFAATDEYVAEVYRALGELLDAPLTPEVDPPVPDQGTTGLASWSDGRLARAAEAWAEGDDVTGRRRLLLAIADRFRSPAAPEDPAAETEEWTFTPGKACPECERSGGNYHTGDCIYKGIVEQGSQIDWKVAYARLRRSRPVSGGLEVVAWRVRHDHWAEDEWTIVESRPDVWDEAEPLYLAPSTHRERNR